MIREYIHTKIIDIYVWATNQKIPVRFVLISGDNKYHSLIDLVNSDIDYANLVNGWITYRDIAFIKYLSGFKNLSVLNKILKAGGFKSYDEPEEFESAFQQWNISYQKEIKDTKAKAALVPASEDYFANINEDEPLVMTKFVTRASEMSFRLGNPEDPDRFFDNIMVDETIPYVHYVNADGIHFYKIYDIDSNTADISDVTTVKDIGDITIEKKSYIIAKIKLDTDVYGIFKYNINKNYILISNVINYIDYTTVVEELLKPNNIHIDADFVLINKNVNVKGNFEIYDPYSESGLFLNAFYFLYYISTDPIASQYLYSEESDKYFGKKKRMDLHLNKLLERSNYNSLSNNSDMTINFNLMMTNNYKTVENYRIPVDNYYLKINLSEINDLDTINNFKIIFEAVYNNYSEEIGNIKIENQVNTERTEDILDKVSTKILEFKDIHQGKKGILFDLKEDTAQYGLIVNDYPRRITDSFYPSRINPNEFDQTDRQILAFPLIYPPNRPLGYYIIDRIPYFVYPEDVKNLPKNINRNDILKFYLDLPPGSGSKTARTKLYYWFDESLPGIDVDKIQFSYKKRKGYTEYTGQFPPETIYFYCKHDDAVYPGVFRNNLSNKKRYPYLPSCYKRDHLDDPESVYNQYFITGETESEIKEDTKGVLIKSTGAGLDPGRISKLPETLEYIFGKHIYKTGIIRSKSSLIHCILKAIDYPEYMNLSTNEEKEDYVIELRRNLDLQVYEPLLSQEGGKVIDLINPLIYFDPSLYYRALEEIYDVNIYVFGPAKNLSDKRETNINKGMMKLPKYKVFHTRPERNYRDNILIYEHMGSDSQGYDYPQCELITNSDEEYFWPSYSTYTNFKGNICYELLKRTLSNVTIFADSNLRVNFYYNHNIEMYPLRFLSQFIDDFGKMIAVNCVHIMTGIELCIYFPPSQPLNLPLSEGFITVDINDIDKIFATKPNSVDRDRGLWFNYGGISNLIYVPITNTTNKYNRLPPGPNDPMDRGYNININETLIKYRRMTAIVVTLIRWLWYFSKNSDDFFDNMIMDENILYKFNIDYMLPNVKSYKEALSYIASKSNLVKNNKIVMRSETLRNRLEFDVSQWIERFRDNPITPPDHIEDYFMHATDYTLEPNTWILEGQDVFNEWQRSVNKFDSLYKIHYLIGNPHSALKNPFILINNNRIYLIYNTGEEKDEAIVRTKNWTLGHGNVNTPIDTDIKIDYKIYIPKHGRVNITGTGIIKYVITDNINKYAAILPL